MTNRLYKIISEVMNVPVTQITNDSGPESIDAWDSFSLYVLLDEIEKEFNIQFSLDEILEIKNVADFKKYLEKHGVNFNEGKRQM